MIFEIKMNPCIVQSVTDWHRDSFHFIRGFYHALKTIGDLDTELYDHLEVALKRYHSGFVPILPWKWIDNNIDSWHPDNTSASLERCIQQAIAKWNPIDYHFAHGFCHAIKIFGLDDNPEYLPLRNKVKSYYERIGHQCEYNEFMEIQQDWIPDDI